MCNLGLGRCVSSLGLRSLRLGVCVCRLGPGIRVCSLGGVVRGCATLVRLGLCGVVRPIWRTSCQFGSGVGSEQVLSMQPSEGLSTIRMVLKAGLYNGVQFDDADYRIR